MKKRIYFIAIILMFAISASAQAHSHNFEHRFKREFKKCKRHAKINKKQRKQLIYHHCCCNMHNHHKHYTSVRHGAYKGKFYAYRDRRDRFDGRWDRHNPREFHNNFHPRPMRGTQPNRHIAPHGEIKHNQNLHKEQKKG